MIKKTIIFYLFSIFYPFFYISGSDTNSSKRTNCLIEIEIKITNKTSSEEEKNKKREDLFNNVKFKEEIVTYFKKMAANVALSNSKSDIQRAAELIEEADKFLFPEEILKINFYEEFRNVFFTEYNHQLAKFLSQNNRRYQQRSNNNSNFFELFDPNANPDNNDFPIDPWN